MTASHTLFVKAQHYIPGGVNSPVRAFGAVGGEPFFVDYAEGAYLIDADGKRYIDYIGSWGPMILGHADDDVIAAVQLAAKKGLSYGVPTELEIHLAEKICQLMPSIELVRMVSSGTEATMSAIRLARGYTQRNKIIKFEGCYHGHSDCLLVKAGSGALTFNAPSSAGVPSELVLHTLVATFNDLDSVSALFAANPHDIAAVIIEPIAGNMNFIPAQAAFLQGLRALCDRYQSVLIFDEVMTGFRVALGGAQSLYQVKPDLTCLGKIIGGGMPVGAFGGRRDIMQQLTPLGAVYQAGTLSGNPIGMTAGLTTLTKLSADKNFYSALAVQTKKLVEGLQLLANQYHIPFTTQHVCGMFGMFFSSEQAITHYQQTVCCNVTQFNAFFHAMLKRGVYFAPSTYEAGFISIKHSDAIIDQTLVAAEQAFREIQ